LQFHLILSKPNFIFTMVPVTGSVQARQRSSRVLKALYHTAKNAQYQSERTAAGIANNHWLTEPLSRKSPQRFCSQQQ
jgi:hypothetical protein